MENIEFADFDDVKKLIFRAQNGRCDLCAEDIVDFHHKLHNTKTNRKLFPLFIDSAFNIVGLCRCCHAQFNYEFNMNEDMARAYEEYLQWVGAGRVLKKK